MIDKYIPLSNLETIHYFVESSMYNKWHNSDNNIMTVAIHYWY